jgi:sulfite reductase (NADPH) flavoprotein alpha-component
LTILVGSETGNSAGLAKSFAEAAKARGIEPLIADMADYKLRKLKDEQDILIITSTHGEGDPPQSAKAFFEFIEGRKAPRLSDKRYAVLALGDSTYEKYCEAGKRLDRRLAELGATALTARVDCDVDYDEPAAAWMAAVLEQLAPATQASNAISSAPIVTSTAIATARAAVASAHDKRNPFDAQVVENIALTGRGSSKETRHIELSLADSNLTFEPGDALGVLPRNEPARIEAILENLSLPADLAVTVKKQRTTLYEAMATDFEITQATPRLIDAWAQISGAMELEGLRGPANAQARTAFLHSNHVIDVLRRFPVKGVDAQAFLAGLRPLQPRLYSIASSQAAAPDEVHLTVSTVRYDLHGQQRTGVASGYFAERADLDSTVPVYVQGNPHFRLADDDTPIVMIGAGTGVAPYRAFMQEREARGASGKAWLFFGDRNFNSDFLYQTEWQDFLKQGVLSRMNVAFSRDAAVGAARDGARKTYVQHRLLEHSRDVYGWLEEGAHVYVCGDAAKLAPDVHATLRDIVEREGGLGRDDSEAYLGSLQSEHRYQIDVY